MARQGAIWGGIAAFVTLATAFTLLADVTEKADVLVQSETEAAADHEQLVQTQAGFNAYTLRLLLEQEIEILELQIDAADEVEVQEVLEIELTAKKTFILKLEEEERKQMMKGAK